MRGGYNRLMQEHRHLPDINRLSILTATILLAFALTRFVNIPERTLALSLPGIYLVYEISFQTIVSALVAGLAATGVDWLLHSHPGLGKRPAFQHWILPSLTTLVIGVPLSTLPDGPEWWMMFGLGGVLLGLVFVAEYIVVDPSDLRHPPATAGLTALSFSLFLILAIALRAGSLRLYLALPAIFVATSGVTLRTFYLRLGGRWLFAWSLGISLFITQVAAALHYWRITPIPYGLILLGPVYALTSLVGSWEEGKSIRAGLVEPLVMLGLVWGLAIILL